MITKKNTKHLLYHIQGGKNILGNESGVDIHVRQISKFLRNDVLNNKANLCLFLGSGCSTPAIPLMGETLKTILVADEEVKKIFQDYLNICEDHKGIFEKYLNGKLTDTEWNIAGKYDYFSNIEAFMTYIKNKIEVERDEEKEEELTRLFELVKSSFIDSIPIHLDPKYEGPQAEIYNEFYKKIFERRQYETPKLNIFTTNYDLFNEVALESNNVYYSTGFTHTLEPSFNINQFNYRLVDERNRYKDRWQPTTKEANLYKLHGSINWREKGEKLVSTNEKNGNVIIYPTILKHQETTQSPYSELFRELSIQLQKVNTTLLIIGYGFGDDHINNIIFQNLVNEDFTLIIFGDRKERKLESIMKKYGANQNIHIIGGTITENGESLKMHYFKYILNCFVKYEDNDDE